ncbi:hypothetical protein LTR37_010214 [Vermiconidia calcicola]|uniref:Uncharacterized protein n=1 Tax=Vermiconidia calcicola TaxID=1690605 RepID=A0ACC3N5Z0_9PEZI|nr:hypothetical protein LTR37_010214 [Vermiconidia calcicola]
MKRIYDPSAGHSQPYKKHKHNDSQRKHPHSSGSPHTQHRPHSSDTHRHQERREQRSLSYEEAITHLPPPTSPSAPIPPYTPFTIPANQLPPLPAIVSPTLATAPFKHRSLLPSYNRSTSSSAQQEMTYERLEFLGDAYIELLATRLIFSRFPSLPAGSQSQLRELLVKNETLAEYSRAYGFDKRVEVGAMEAMLEDGRKKFAGNKGFNKVLGDVFEAYVSAVILDGVEVEVVEKWLTALWAPKLVEAARNDRSYAYNPELALTHDADTADPLKIYNPTAKADLQKRLQPSRDVKLSYETYKDSVELKGDQLGQNRHFIALYLTGYGYERKLLGEGEGKNKVEAGNWAATEAMYGDCKGIVEQCEKKSAVIKEEKRKEREREEAAQAGSA